MRETNKIYWDLTADNVPELQAWLVEHRLEDALKELQALRDHVGEIAPRLQSVGSEVDAAKVLRPLMHKALYLSRELKSLGYDGAEADDTPVVNAIKVVNDILWQDSIRRKQAELDREAREGPKLAPTDVIKWGPPNEGGWKASQIRAFEKAKTRMKK
jgi:hypothetical protein